MLNKKGDVAVAGGILVIGLLFLGYVMVLPTEEKCKYLPDLDECDGANQSSLSKTEFLSEQPGFLEQIENATEYDLGSIELFNREVTEFPLKFSSDPSVETAWFNTKKIEQEFIVPGKVKKVLLFINVEASSTFSALYIILNDNTIARLVGPGTHIVDLPSNNLIKHDNTLVLKASTPFLPGFRNKFEINSLILKQTYELTQSETRRMFIVEQDVNDIKSAVLEFTSDCYGVEPLRIILNNVTITEENICAKYTNDVKNILAQNNRIILSSEGNYFVRDMKLNVKFLGRDFKTYYFALSKENLDKIKDGKVLAFLKLNFPDAERKKLTIFVNGNPINVDTNKVEFKTVIGELLKQGQNSVRIKPEQTVTISNLAVFFE